MTACYHLITLPRLCMTLYMHRHEHKTSPQITQSPLPHSWSYLQIRQLEQEKAITTGAFSSRSSDLSYALTNAQESLEAMRQERDAWRDRAEAAEARVAELEESNGELQKTLSEERGTVMKALKEFHDKESERGVSARCLGRGRKRQASRQACGEQKQGRVQGWHTCAVNKVPRSKCCSGWP